MFPFDDVLMLHIHFNMPYVLELDRSIKLRDIYFTPQTVMRVEFHPALIMAEHGKWRFYDNIELV